MNNFILELTYDLLYDWGQSQMKVKHCQQTKTKNFKNITELSWQKCQGSMSIKGYGKIFQLFCMCLTFFIYWELVFNMIKNKRYIQKVQNWIELNQDNTYKNELMSFGQSRTKSTRKSVFEYYFEGKIVNFARKVVQMRATTKKP